MNTLLGREVRAVRPVSGGFTQAERGIALLDDGREVFFKTAADALTAGWLRDEHAVYSQLRAPFLPDFLDWMEGDRPTLVLEALPPSGFPPPWTPEAVKTAREVLCQVADTPPPPGLSPIAPDAYRGWASVADDPEPLLRIGFADAGWLDAHLFTLVEAEASVDCAGNSLLHQDFRSDNFCIADRPVIVDWNWACVGNPVLDVAFWLPSLALERGPRPWEVLPASPGLAAAVSGFFAAREAIPRIPEPIRVFQRRQLSVAARWAARELRLTPPRTPYAG